MDRHVFHRWSHRLRRRFHRYSHRSIIAAQTQSHPNDLQEVRERGIGNREKRERLSLGDRRLGRTERRYRENNMMNDRKTVIVLKMAVIVNPI